MAEWWDRLQAWWRGPLPPLPADQELAPRDHVSYGKLMLELTERSLGTWTDRQGLEHPKMTLADRETQVRAWADHYRSTRPALAQALTGTAEQYRALITRGEAQSVQVRGATARQRLLQRAEIRHERSQRQEIALRY
jgi:hypothetical protein